MSQDNWIKLDEKPAVMGWNFDLKGTSINGNKKLNKIELTQEDLDKINNSDQPLIKVETRSIRDCFSWSENSHDPDEYIRRMTDRNEHERHLEANMRLEVEFHNFNENDIVDIMANAGKHIDRLYDVGVITENEYADFNAAIENRTKDLVKKLYSCRAAIEERDICADAFNRYNQRIYITEEEHTERMAKLYDKSSVKFDNILDMISKKRASMWRDWLPEDWRRKNNG